MEGDPDIIFKEKKVEHLDSNHDGALVISTKMINTLAKRVIINIEINLVLESYEVLSSSIRAMFLASRCYSTFAAAINCPPSLVVDPTSADLVADSIVITLYRRSHIYCYRPYYN
ncbi:hypothetical protein BHE74_00052082 [Ensete ventricosum]|nr:hypothetical protein BHE74_00052082 [Ensete ventricosum]